MLPPRDFGRVASRVGGTRAHLSNADIVAVRSDRPKMIDTTSKGRRRDTAFHIRLHQSDGPLKGAKASAGDTVDLAQSTRNFKPDTGDFEKRQGE
jgi:hypothetical protein